ncbi:P-loop containing nucleoside triphosphate hydrolase protein [Dunaliella salina]|uniref:P-loop containing nucleoside triphosphate hydrolase protein n=1 Tax=Dunaliella salina TaxID=3046 RepID=A0ABQ7G3I5_DUNSA|nr:P-loop containing nucleoside triphosphate hydrolase protein [Dunaliella salina]|eukprot:KAF5829167.1 P-loop containing nucleoside triphosphate hydrolase protein [Dunaliella salina]
MHACLFALTLSIPFEKSGNCHVATCRDAETLNVMSRDAVKANFSPRQEGSRIPVAASSVSHINSDDNHDRTANDRVKVILRVRPPTASDGRRPSPLEFDPTKPNKLILHRPDAPVTHTEFEFDRVLPPGATQQDVYLSGVKDVVDDVLKGYNGTVMAYGQTGAGKTYTLGNIQPQAIGMIPRCAAEIFYQASSDPFHSYSVSMSYIQIYMELIQDLLNPQSDNLVIREDSGNGVFVAGVQEVPVSSLEECLHYLAVGEQNRAFAFTHLNAHSSRSHAVVMLTVVKRRRYLTPAEKQAEKKAEREGVSTHKVKVGKLYLVDLAGSERLKKSKSVGQRATEARSINLSLTTLGMCISARAMDDKHVPFRDSKLTRLLQESLGGNAKTTLLVNVASAQEHADETMQSLSFASRAMCVKNKPVVNERVDYKILHAELQSRMDKENDRASHLEVALSKKEEALDDAMQIEKANMAEKHYSHVAMLNAQITASLAPLGDDVEPLRLLLELGAPTTAQQHNSDLPPLAHKPDQSRRHPAYHRQSSAPVRTSAAAAAAAVAAARASAPSLGNVAEEPAPSMAATHGSNAVHMSETLAFTSTTLAPSAANSIGEHPSDEFSRSSTADEGVVGFSSGSNVQGAGQEGAQASARNALTGAAGRDREAGGRDKDPVVEWAPQTAEMAEAESLQEGPTAAGALESMTGRLLKVDLSGRLLKVTQKWGLRSYTRQASQWLVEAAGLLRYLNATAADRDTTAADLEATRSELEAMRSEIEATRSELDATRSELEATRSDLEAATSQLALAAGEMAAVHQKLEDAELEGSDLNGQATSLRAQVAELQEHVGAKNEQIADLEHQIQGLHEQLMRESEAKKAAEGHLEANYSSRFELLLAHVEARKRMAAVLTIQRCYRHWRSRVGAQHRAAQIGAGLVMDSMSVLRDGLNNLFSTFMASTSEMEAVQALKQRLATAAPILAEQRRQQQQQAAQNAGPLGKPRNHAAYAASLQEPTTPARSRATSSGQRPQLPRDGDAPAAAHSRPPTHSASSAIPQSARLQQQQSQRQLQGASRPSEVIEEDASATAFPVPQHRLARSAGPAKPGRADSGRSGSGRARAPL